MSRHPLFEQYKKFKEIYYRYIDDSNICQILEKEAKEIFSFTGYDSQSAIINNANFIPHKTIHNKIYKEDAGCFGDILK